MDQKQIVKQVMDINKATFDNSFYAMTAMQDHTEKLVLSFLEKAPWFPEEGKKAINEWGKTYKKGREDFKSAADKNYKNIAGHFAGAEVGKTNVGME